MGPTPHKPEGTRTDRTGEGIDAEWLGDRGVLVSIRSTEAACDDGRALALAARLRRAAFPGVLDVIPAYGAALVLFDPAAAESGACASVLAAARAAADEAAELAPRRCVDVPVCYDIDLGPDLAMVAESAGLGVERVIALHTGASYHADFLGFMPGFGYLSGMPSALHTPRLPQPRTRVPAGSVGIAGGQTGVYPSDSPGGWRLIGRTPLRMFDASRPRPSIIEPGDAVRFVPISRAHFDELAAGPDAGVSPLSHASTGALRVHHPGHFTSVQDLGRFGHAHLGVAQSGAADTLALRLGNRLVGNPDHAAGLEMTLSGCVLEANEDVVLAITGARAACVLTCVGGKLVELPDHRAHTIRIGERLRIGALRDGARAYVCIRGGIDTAPVLNSRSTHAPSGLGGLGGRGLRAGDMLRLGAAPTGAPAPNLASDTIASLRAHATRTRLRILPGPDADEATLGELCRGVHRVSEQSDRSGVRLAARVELGGRTGNMPTQPVMAGCVQLPPGGGPIILGPDGPTTGGYSVVAAVISADWPALARLRPGDEVGFDHVTLAQARASLAQVNRDLDRACPPLSAREG